MTELAAGSLRGRLLRRLAILLAIPLLIGSLSAYWNGRHAADAAYDRTLLASARAIADGLYTEDGKLRADVPYVALDPFAYDLEGRIFYQVSDLEGRVVSGYDGLPAPPPGTPRTDDYPALAHFYDGEFDGVGVRLVSLLQPVSEPGMNGMAEIRVAETDVARLRMARGLLLDTLWRMGLLALITLALVGLAVSAALRPLERLRTAVEERQPDDLEPLPMVQVQDELRPLVASLNHFTERLSTDRLTHLANQLLSLARIERAARAVSEGGAERVELAQLARELGMALAPLAHQRGIALALEADTEVWLRGEPMLLHELIYNLVDNALAHTPGGNVVVRVLAPALLEVEDDGPGIPPEERERVFERFYRRNPHVGGAGLGLAIVGEICRAHRAEIELGQGALGGLLVRVSFPPAY